MLPLTPTARDLFGAGEETPGGDGTRQTEAGGGSEAQCGLSEGPGETEGGPGGDSQKVRTFTQSW